MARVLVVAARRARRRRRGERSRRGRGAVPQRGADLRRACRNRMDRNGRWTDEPATDDAWGRCLWGLGTAAAHSDVSLVRRMAVIQFERAAQVRSTWPRAMAFAALGAAELLSRRSRARGGPRTDHRLCRRHSPGPSGDRRLAMARAAAHLRQRGASRGDDRRRGRARGRRHCGSAAWICWPGCSTTRQPTATCRPRPPAAGARATPGRASTSSRSRWPALADACARAAAVDASRDLAGRGAGRRGLVRGRQRRRPGRCGTRRRAAGSTDCTPTG